MSQVGNVQNATFFTIFFAWKDHDFSYYGECLIFFLLGYYVG
jgi:hypothetical protein